MHSLAGKKLQILFSLTLHQPMRDAAYQGIGLSCELGDAETQIKVCAGKRQDILETANVIVFRRPSRFLRSRSEDREAIADLSIGLNDTPWKSQILNDVFSMVADFVRSFSHGNTPASENGHYGFTYVNLLGKGRMKEEGRLCMIAFICRFRYTNIVSIHRRLLLFNSPVELKDIGRRWTL
jgi:hypothetical protein